MGAVARILSTGRVPLLFANWPLRLLFLLYFIAVLSALTREANVALFDDSLNTYTSSVLLIVLTLILVDTVERLKWVILCLVGSYAWDYPFQSLNSVDENERKNNQQN